MAAIDLPAVRDAFIGVQNACHVFSEQATLLGQVPLLNQGALLQDMQATQQTQRTQQQQLQTTLQQVQNQVEGLPERMRQTMQGQMQEMREALQQQTIELRQELTDGLAALGQKLESNDERSFARLRNSRISDEDTKLSPFPFPPTANNPPPFPQSRRAISKLNGQALQALLLAWNIQPPASVDECRTAVLRHVGLPT